MWLVVVVPTPECRFLLREQAAFRNTFDMAVTESNVPAPAVPRGEPAGESTGLTKIEVQLNDIYFWFLLVHSGLEKRRREYGLLDGGIPDAVGQWLNRRRRNEFRTHY